MAAVEMQSSSGAASSKPAAAVSHAPLVPAPSVSSLSVSSPQTLSLVLSRAGRFDILSTACRAHLSTHLECGRTWYLLSLSLMASGRYEECFLAVRECLQRHPADVPALLLAAQLCLDRLQRHKESVEYASRALRAIKAQMAQQAAQQQAGAAAVAAVVASRGDAPAVPTSLATLASDPHSAASSSSSSFASLARSPQVSAALLLSAQLLFGQACGKYAYHVSTFSNRKSLQKRALHALEHAYEQQQHSGGGAAGSRKHTHAYSSSSASASSTPSSPAAFSAASHTGPVLVSHRKLLFSLACVYADTREIGRAMKLLTRALHLDRACGPSWNLLALLLSSQKKHAAAVRACAQGLLQVTGGSALQPPSDAELESGAVSSTVRAALPLMLTQARLQAHMGRYEDAIQTFNDIVSVTFAPSQVQYKHVQRVGGFPVSAASAAAGPLQRPYFAAAAARAREASAGSGADGAVAAGGAHANTARVGGDVSATPASEWAATRVDVLLALAQLYAAQANAQGAAGAVASTLARDDSLLADALSCVSLARELAPASMLAEVHSSLAALSAQGGPSGTAHAVRHYERALALDSQHTPALIGLARLEAQRRQGNLVLAYGYLLQALQVDATSHHAWYEMALVLQSQGKASPAAEHFLTALQLERTAPIASFASIRREFGSIA